MLFITYNVRRVQKKIKPNKQKEKEFKINALNYYYVPIELL